MVDEGKRITFRVEDELFERLAECCDLLKISVSSFVRDSIEASLKGVKVGQNGEVISYEKQIEELQAQISGLEAEVKFQTLRADYAELKTENATLKSELNRVKGESQERE